MPMAYAAAISTQRGKTNEKKHFDDRYRRRGPASVRAGSQQIQQGDPAADLPPVVQQVTREVP
jgi:hypothetical protein